jgi:uncharacterized membrane protein YedE/YeeE
MKRLTFYIGPIIGGIVFAIGLGISGMSEADKIVGFLDVFGRWQGELLAVMGGALLTYGILFRFITKMPKPLFEQTFKIPTRQDFDKRLVVGAILFGLGWGITGLCPAPGIVSIVSGKAHAIVFVIAMPLGMILGRSKLGENFLK